MEPNANFPRVFEMPGSVSQQTPVEQRTLVESLELLEENDFVDYISHERLTYIHDYIETLRTQLELGMTIEDKENFKIYMYEILTNLSIMLIDLITALYQREKILKMADINGFEAFEEFKRNLPEKSPESEN